MNSALRYLIAAAGLCMIACSTAGLHADEPPRGALPGTEPLTLEGDIASHLVEGVDRFLLGEIAQSVERRGRHWNRDLSSADAYQKSIEPNRKRLAHILGVRDERVPFDGLELVGTTAQPPLVAEGDGYKVFAVRWPAFGDVHGEGLLAVPADPEKYVADVIAIPDADQTPEMLLGLVEGVAPESQFARRLTESGCRVLVPVLINRAEVKPAEIDPKLPPQYRLPLSNREFLYRSAFELGRHLIGYEIQKVLAGVDFFAGNVVGTRRVPSAADHSQRKPSPADGTRRVPATAIGVIGWGEGGMLALCAGALDPRIDAVCVSGYFEPRENVWQELIDRNVFGLLEQFGDAELAAMIAPRTLVVEAARGPEVVVAEQATRGGPGRLRTPDLGAVRREVERAQTLVQGLAAAKPIRLIPSGDGSGPYGTADALEALLDALSPGAKLAASDPGTVPVFAQRNRDCPLAESDATARHRRQMHEINRHSQWLLAESPYVRKDFFSKLDTSSLEKFNETIEPYRDFFRDEVIGRFDCELLEPNVRSRTSYDEPKWTGYEVVMDVWPDVIAYGILLVPKGIKPGERRPVVVCQHGLEGRPQDVVRGEDRAKNAYEDFAAQLAERGFVAFAPQNLYIFKDRFRTLQRKANPLGKTLFSVIVPQHQQIVDWLQSLPYVDPERIAFYGLSYGGKSAMRIPPLVRDYCLSICSADFNEWVWKNAATNTAGRYSYVFTGEYEIFEFDLGSTFNYAEMAALVAPRPFMVERGHFDGVAPDETVAYEFAKVRHLYAAQLGLGDRCAIEWFVGPHKINGVGTFEFLHEHLDWPKPE